MSALSKIASGVGWGTVSIVVITLFQLFFMAVMARLLEPADFGLIAIANVSLRFYSYFSQVGIAPALIQKKTLEKGDTNAALALSLSISSLFFLIAYFASPFTELYFEMPNLALVMQVLALNFIIMGFSSISQALLRRESKFKAISMIEVVSYVLGYGVTGLIAAYMGLGVWALVIAFMTQSTLTALLSYLAIRYPISFKHTKAQRRHLIGFGARYSLIGFIEFLTSNLAPLIIGKLLGAAPAGFFNRAQLLAHLPVQQPTNILTKTLFPVMSRMSDEHAKQLISFQISALIVGCYASAVGIGLYNAANDIVIVLLGVKWTEAIPILKILSLSAAPIYLAHVASVTFHSMAELKVELRIQVAIILLLILQLLCIAENISVVNVSYVILLTAFIRMLFMCGSMISLLKMKKNEVFLIIIILLSVTLITGAFTYSIPNILIPVEAPVLRLIIDVIAGAIGLTVSMLFVRYFLRPLHSIIYLEQRLPRFKKLMEI